MLQLRHVRGLPGARARVCGGGSAHERWTVISSGTAVKSWPLGTQAVLACEAGVFTRGSTDDCRSLSNPARIRPGRHMFRFDRDPAVGHEPVDVGEKL